MRILLILCTVVFLTPGCATKGTLYTDILAITNANIIPMSGEGIQENTTIVIEGGYIREIGDSNDVTPPKEARTYDATGKYIIPGLSDAHVHLFDEGDLSLFLAHGVTSVLNMSGSYMHLKLRSDIASGKILGPQIFTTGPMMKTDAAPMIEFEETITSPSDAESVVKSYAQAGYNFAKIWGAFSPATYMAIVDAAKQNNIPIVGHIPRDVGLENVLQTGQLIAHVEEYTNKHFRGRITKADIDAAAKVTAAANAPVITTLITYEAIAGAASDDMTPLLNRQGYELLDRTRQQLWTPQFNRYRTPGRIGRQDRYLNILNIQKMIALSLNDNGATLLAGTDAGELPGLVPGLDLHRELQLLVDAGLSEYEALKTATVNFGSTFSSSEYKFGAIEAGMGADLVILTANPLDDISNSKKIDSVVRSGELLDRANLDLMIATLKERNAVAEPFVNQVLEKGVDAAIDTFSSKPLNSQKIALTPGMLLSLGLADQGDIKGSITLLRFLADQHPNRPEPWFIIGGFYSSAGDKERALLSYNEVLARAPNHERAKREVAHLKSVVASVQAK